MKKELIKEIVELAICVAYITAPFWIAFLIFKFK
jgi:hypothetical protein